MSTIADCPGTFTFGHPDHLEPWFDCKCLPYHDSFFSGSLIPPSHLPEPRIGIDLGSDEGSRTYVHSTVYPFHIKGAPMTQQNTNAPLDLVELHEATLAKAIAVRDHVERLSSKARKWVHSYRTGGDPSVTVIPHYRTVGQEGARRDVGFAIFADRVEVFRGDTNSGAIMGPLDVQTGLDMIETLSPALTELPSP